MGAVPTRLEGMETEQLPLHRQLVLKVPTRLEGMESDAIREIIEKSFLSRPDLRGWKDSFSINATTGISRPDPT